MVGLKELDIQYNDGPVEDCRELIQNLTRGLRRNYIVFIHCRESVEIEKLEGMLLGIGIETSTLLLTRSGMPNYNTKVDQDVGVPRDYDYSIDNNGSMEELKLKASHYIRSLIPSDWR